MSDAPVNSNVLAFGRTMMALERTLMAWIRTSLSLISFGFTIFKFLTAMQDKNGIGIRENAPRNMGLFLILLGMGALVLAIFQFVKVREELGDRWERKPRLSISLLIGGGVLLVGVFTLLNIFFGFGGF